MHLHVTVTCYLKILNPASKCLKITLEVIKFPKKLVYLQIDGGGGLSPIPPMSNSCQDNPEDTDSFLLQPRCDSTEWDHTEPNSNCNQYRHDPLQTSQQHSYYFLIAIILTKYLGNRTLKTQRQFLTTHSPFTKVQFSNSQNVLIFKTGLYATICDHFFGFNLLAQCLMPWLPLIRRVLTRPLWIIVSGLFISEHKALL
jgi:hypothetical protein